MEIATPYQWESYVFMFTSRSHKSARFSPKPGNAAESSYFKAAFEDVP
jgi:hypothetical protein